MKKKLLFFVILLITVVTMQAQSFSDGASNSVSSPCSSITQFPWTEGFEVAFPAAVAPGNAAAPSC